MEVVVNKIISHRFKEGLIDELEYKKIKYGLELILINLFKLISMISIAMYMDSLTEMIIYLIGFMIIRKTAFGAHAKYFLQCLILTNLFMAVSILISRDLKLSFLGVTLIFLVNIAVLYRYAPANTSKRKIKSKIKRELLRKKTIKSAIILYIICILFGNKISNLILIGMSVATLMTTPFMYLILEGSYMNYEKYNK